MSQERRAAKPGDAMTSGKEHFTKAVRALTRATEDLKTTTARMTRMLQPKESGESVAGSAGGDSTSASADIREGHPSEASGASQPDDDAKLFYERLEQMGQLIDWDEGMDIANLPSRVTHVRRPDGTIERIGFS